MMTGKPEFLIEEYKALRKEILFHAKYSRCLEATIIIAVTVIYTWSFTSKGDVNFIWWVPPILSIIGGVRELGNRARNARIAEYLQKIESYFSDEKEPKGWENHLKPLRVNTKNKPLTISTISFWLVLIILTITISVAFGL